MSLNYAFMLFISSEWSAGQTGISCAADKKVKVTEQSAVTTWTNYFVIKLNWWEHYEI